MVPEEMKYLNFKFEVNLFLWGEKDINIVPFFIFERTWILPKTKARLTFTCSKSTIEILEKGVKYVQVDSTKDIWFLISEIFIIPMSSFLGRQ